MESSTELVDEILTADDTVSSGGQMKEMMQKNLLKEIDVLHETLREKNKNLEVLKLKLAAGPGLIEAADAVEKVDAGIQFNWVDLKTDHLQGITVFESKYFNVHGEQPHPLIWEGFGFELHLSEHTFLSNEECCIKIDAVCAGDFVIPEGVEPVSAIYIISATTKLRQSSLLRIQHCVDLQRADHTCQLSFYRASLKEEFPPYHFKCISGGKFDASDKYGELELPVFCAQVIGKSKHLPSTEHGEQSVNEGEESNDAQQTTDNATSISSGFSDVDQDEQFIDDSIMFRGRLFYKELGLNEWQCMFIVVKNLDAFNKYIISNMKEYEKDAQIDMVCTSNYIELVISENSDFIGWTVIKHTNPCTLPITRIKSFGYKKEEADPPFCLLTVFGDTCVPGHEDRLHYPVPLKGCVTGEGVEPVKIFINRKIVKDTRHKRSGSPSKRWWMLVAVSLALIAVLIGMSPLHLASILSEISPLQKLPSASNILQQPDSLDSKPDVIKNDEVLKIWNELPLTNKLEAFCINLGLDSSSCREIKETNSKYDDQRSDLLHVWSSTKDMTWCDMVKALDGTKYCRKAKHLAKEHSCETCLINC